MFLSIIIPVYNVPEDLLRECIESCLEQDISKAEYEIICIDDGSTDNSLSVLKGYESKFSNVKVISQPNSGVSVARNRGIDSSSGEYIWFVDSDDFVVKNSFLKLKDFLSKNSAERINLGAYHFIGTLPIEKYEATKKGELKPNYEIRTVCVTRSLYNRLFLKRNSIYFKQGVAFGEDMLFNFEVDQVAHKEVQFEELFYFYRIHKKSATHGIYDSKRAIKFIDAHITGCKIVKGYYDNDSVKKMQTIRYLHTDLGQIMINISKLDFQQAKSYLKDILENNLFPYMRWKFKGFLLSFYTNLYSFSLVTICRLATLKMFFWIIQLWSIIWQSKIKKKFEKIIKKILR